MPNTIRVELFGIAARRAGVAATEATGGNLGDVLADLARNYPGLTGSCVADRRLAGGFVANLNGERFISDPSTPLVPGDALLILSADAGG